MNSEEPVTWKGKRIDLMTREELIVALKQAGVLYTRLLEDRSKRSPTNNNYLGV